MRLPGRRPRQGQVINDMVDDHPYLVVVNPFAAPALAFSIFDAKLDGHRVTMAPRAISRTESRCSTTGEPRVSGSNETDVLTAIAGKHKRQASACGIAHPTPVTWSDVGRHEHRRAALLVGADRVSRHSHRVNAAAIPAADRSHLASRPGTCATAPTPVPLRVDP